MKYQDEKQGFAPRMDEEGHHRRVVAKHTQVTDRPQILRFCEFRRREDALEFLITKANERRQSHAELLKNFDIAARGRVDEVVTPIPDDLLNQWLQEFDEPSLF